jgi:hypothetical protein
MIPNRLALIPSAAVEAQVSIALQGFQVSFSERHVYPRDYYNDAGYFLGEPDGTYKGVPIDTVSRYFPS